MKSNRNDQGSFVPSPPGKFQVAASPPQPLPGSRTAWGIRCFFGAAIGGLAWAVVGCELPVDPNAKPVVEQPPEPKKPAQTVYGKAFEATDRLKEKVAEHNDRLEDLAKPLDQQRRSEDQ